MAKNRSTRKRIGSRPRQPLGLPPEDHRARAIERYQFSAGNAELAQEKIAAGDCKGAVRPLFMALEKSAMAASDHQDTNAGVPGAMEAMDRVTAAEEAFVARCVRRR